MAPSVRFPITQQFTILAPFLSERRHGYSPLASAAVLPEQFFAHHNGVHSGIRTLMLAILEDALACFYKQFVTNSHRARRLGTEAENWIFTDDVCWPFSFVNICHVLGLEPAYIRRCLQQRQHSPLAARRKSSHTVFPQRPHKVAA